MLHFLSVSDTCTWLWALKEGESNEKKWTLFIRFLLYTILFFVALWGLNLKTWFDFKELNPSAIVHWWHYIIIIPLAFGQKRHTPLISAISIKQYALWQDITLTICGPISGRGILVEILHLPSDSPKDCAPSTQPRVVFIKSQLLRHWHVGLGKKTGGWQRRKDYTARKRESRDGVKDSSRTLSSQNNQQQQQQLLVSKVACTLNGGTWETIESDHKRLLWKF